MKSSDHFNRARETLDLITKAQDDERAIDAHDDICNGLEALEKEKIAAIRSRGNIYQSQPLPQVMATLYFGRSVPHGREVIDTHSFQTFLAESVTPHFPGFTVQESVGYWKGQRELVYVLTLLSEDSDNFRHQCREIAEHYKTRFHQEAVGIAFVHAQYSMETWPHGPVSAYHRPGLGY